MTIVAPARTPRPAAARTAPHRSAGRPVTSAPPAVSAPPSAGRGEPRRAPAPPDARPGFVLYVGVDRTHEGTEIVELAEALSELARDWLPDADTYTAVRLADARTAPGRGAGPRTAAPATPAAAAAAVDRDVESFRERLARISGVPRLVIDAAARTVTVDDRAARLTTKEFDLLSHLARAAGRTVTRDELLTSVWDRGAVREGTRTVDVHVRRVREKLDLGYVITTVRGVGYRFATNAEVVLEG